MIWIRFWNCWWPFKKKICVTRLSFGYTQGFCFRPELSGAAPLPVWWLGEWVTYYSSLWVKRSIDTVATHSLKMSVGMSHRLRDCTIELAHEPTRWLNFSHVMSLESETPHPHPYRGCLTCLGSDSAGPRQCGVGQRHDFLGHFCLAGHSTPLCFRFWVLLLFCFVFRSRVTNLFEQLGSYLVNRQNL